jgi:hypothetical protein
LLAADRSPVMAGQIEFPSDCLRGRSNMQKFIEILRTISTEPGSFFAYCAGLVVFMILGGLLTLLSLLVFYLVSPEMGETIKDGFTVVIASLSFMLGLYLTHKIFARFGYSFFNYFSAKSAGPAQSFLQRGLNKYNLVVAIAIGVGLLLVDNLLSNLPD